MTWNLKQLQERFATQDRTADREIPVLRKKAAKNNTYKGFHDRQIGAQQVFNILTSTAALTNRSAFIAKLQSMRESEPVQTTGAFDAEKVKLGWNETLDALLDEFSKQ